MQPASLSAHLETLTPGAREQLERLAMVVGAAAGRAQAETMLEAEEQMAQAVPASPLEQAVENLLTLLEPWVREAVNVPRAKGSQQARMLEAAKHVLRMRAEEQRDEGPAP